MGSLYPASKTINSFKNPGIFWNGSRRLLEQMTELGSKLWEEQINHNHYSALTRAKFVFLKFSVSYLHPVSLSNGKKVEFRVYKTASEFLNQS